MSLPTGCISNLLGTAANQDLASIYDVSNQTLVGGSTATNILAGLNYGNKDLGSIFTLYNNLSGANLTGTRGNPCGYIISSSGVDIGTLFVQSGTVTNNISPFQSILMNKPPWGVYDASLWNATSKILPEARGNGRDVTSSGTALTTGVSTTDGATNIAYLNGTTASIMIWPSGSIPTQFTMCSITRYSGSSKGRILTGANIAPLIDWSHGHKVTTRGYTQYGNNKYNSTSRGTLTDWLVCCGNNGTSVLNSLLEDGVAVGLVSGGTGGSTMAINSNPFGGELSDWQFSYCIIWDQVLTDAEMKTVSDTLLNYKQNGVKPNIYPSVSLSTKSLQLSYNIDMYATGTNAAYYNTANVSIEAWIKIPVGTFQGGKFDNSINIAASYGAIAVKQAYAGICVDRNNNLMVFQNNGTVYPNGVANISVGDGNWHHVAITLTTPLSTGDNNLSAIYVDGVKKTNFTWRTFATNTNFTIGIVDAGNVNYRCPFVGQIAYVRYWNQCLDDSFIATYYNQYLDPACYTNLIGFYPMNEGNGYVLYNLAVGGSSYNLNITGATLSTISPTVITPTMITNSTIFVPSTLLVNPDNTNWTFNFQSGYATTTATVTAPATVSYNLAYTAIPAAKNYCYMNLNTILPTSVTNCNRLQFKCNFYLTGQGFDVFLSCNSLGYGLILRLSITGGYTGFYINNDWNFSGQVQKTAPPITVSTSTWHALIINISNIGVITYTIDGVTNTDSYIIPPNRQGTYFGFSSDLFSPPAGAYVCNLNVNQIGNGIYNPIPTGSRGLYACKWVNDNYTGPIMQLRIKPGATDISSNFYTNNAGTVVGTALGGLGTPLSSWVNANGGVYGTTPIYIVYWYDQSPTSSTASGKNAYQTATQESQPTFSLDNGYIDFSSNLYFNLPDGTIPFGDSNYTISWNINSIPASPGYGVLFFSGSTIFQGTLPYTNSLRVNGTEYWNEWADDVLYNKMFNVYVANSYNSFVYDNAAKTISLYTNSAAKTSVSTSAIGARNSGTGNNMIGNGAGYEANHYFNGKLSYLSFYNTILSNTNINVMESLNTYSTGLYTSLPTGCQCLYACQWVNNNYTGPILQLRIKPGATDISQNFYTNSAGTVFGTQLDGTGLSLNNWVANNSGTYGTTPMYVATWYDQSTLGNHATQTTLASQPLFTVAQGITFSTSTLLNVPTTMLSAGNVPFTVSTYFTGSSAGLDYFFNYGSSAAGNQIQVLYSNNGLTLWGGVGGSAASAVTTTTSNILTYTYNNTGSNNANIYFNKSDTANGTNTLSFNYTANIGTIGSNSFTGTSSFFSLFNTVLSRADRQTMEAISPLGLLTTLPTGCQGLYACQWVNNNYRGPILQLRINVYSVDYTQDFYTNSSGSSIGTLFGGLGISLKNWIIANGGLYGTTVVYVVTWYDQSVTSTTASGKNVSQSNTTYQPIFDPSNCCVDFKNATTSSYLNIPTGMFSTANSGNNSYTLTYKLMKTANITNTQETVFLYGNHSTTNQESEIYVNNGTGGYVMHAFYGNGACSYSTPSMANPVVISCAYDSTNTTRYVYYNQSVAYDTSSNSGTFAYSTGGTQVNTLGVPSTISNNKFNGSLGFFSIFNTLLSSTDRSKMEKSSLSSFVVNGYFTSPVQSTNGYSNNITNINWTQTVTGNTYIINGSSSTHPFYDYILPTGITQYCGLQMTGTSITQPVYLIAGKTYTLYFYAAPRMYTVSAYYSTNTTLNVTVGSQTLTATPIVGNVNYHHFVIYSYNFTVPTTMNYDLTFKNIGVSGVDSTWLISGVNIIDSTGITGLLSSVPTGCQGLFACNWVNNNYTGPILQLRMNLSSTDYIQDFYMDSTGTLIGTSLGGKGVSLSSWVSSYGGTYGTTVIYVVKWYDQSPTSSTASGKNAYQTTTTKQPTFNLANRYIDFSTPANAYFLLPDGTVPTGNSAYTVTTKHSTMSSASGTWLSGNSATASSGEFILRLDTSGYHQIMTDAGGNATRNTFWGSTYSNYQTGNVVTFKYDYDVSRNSCYTNNVLTGSFTSTGVNATGTLNNSIGSQYGSGGYLNGQLYYLSIYNSALSDISRNTIENINSSVGLYTSLPSGCVALYACQWVNNNYRGPILQLRINVSSVDYIQDFYMDSTGILIGTLLGGTGTSLASWVANKGGTYGTTPVYVVQWYDQSVTSLTASGNNAYQTGSTAYQPLFDVINGVNFYKASGASVLRLPTNMISNGIPSYSVIYKIGDGSLLSTATNQMSVLMYGTHLSYQEINFSTKYNSPNYLFTNSVMDRGEVGYTTSNVTAPNNFVVSGVVNSANTNRYIYENGVLKASASYIVSSTTYANILNTASSDTTNTISTSLSGTYFNNFQGSLKHMCLFNTAISDTDRNTMEAISPTGLLKTPPTGSQGLFACKWVNNNYRGPILQLRINVSSVDYTQNFYMNSSGTSIGTLLGGIGTSLASWVTINGGIYGTTPMYVVSWYDQSPTSTTATGNNASQNTTTLQPTFQLVSGVYYINFPTSGNCFFNLANAPVPTGSNTTTIAYKMHTYVVNSGVVVGAGGAVTLGDCLAIGYYMGAYSSDNFGSNPILNLNKAIVPDAVVFTVIASSNYNLSINGTNYSATGTKSLTSASGNNFIGKSNYSADGFLQGQISFVFIGNTAITSGTTDFTNISSF